eukprot:m.1139717 g.1139717  ORF g.1139717 m.1139717 type:complete len:111 (+) comp24442_c0_seq4:2964-3296(+)
MWECRRKHVSLAVLTLKQCVRRKDMLLFVREIVDVRRIGHTDAVMQASQAQQCISLLLDANADPHAKNADKLTPSALAGEIGNKRLVAFLGTKVAAPVLWNLSKSKMAPT